jgi:hypothetical protein
LTNRFSQISLGHLARPRCITPNFQVGSRHLANVIPIPVV